MKARMLLLASVVLTAPAVAQQRLVRGLRATPDVAIRLWVPAGMLEVQAWDHDSVEVRATPGAQSAFGGGGTAASMKFAFESAVGSDTLLPSGAMRVRVPRGAKVWIKSTIATVHVQGVWGELELLQVSGPTTVSDTRGTVTVESIDGRIDLRRVAGTLRVRGGSGDLVANGLAGTIDVSLVGGSATLVNGPAVGTNVPASTEPMLNGRIETVGGTLTMLGSPGLGSVLDLATHDGHVRMMLTGPKPPFVEANIPTASIDVRMRSGDRAIGTFRIRTFKGTVNASFGGGI